MRKEEKIANLRKRCGFYIGIDNLVNLIEENNTSYPPFNLSWEGSNTQLLEISLANFTAEEIFIETHGVYLIISGQKKPTADRNFIIKQIATRSFRKQFIISNNGFVKQAFFQHSILKIIIEYPTATRRNIKISNYNQVKDRLPAPRKRTNLLPR
jgi:HSP20 family molecular chaperone IbpA